jgi:hypothetical protein
MSLSFYGWLPRIPNMREKEHAGENLWMRREFVSAVVGY